MPEKRQPERRSFRQGQGGKHKPEDYDIIRRYGIVLRSKFGGHESIYVNYIRAQQAKACAEGAPLSAVYSRPTPRPATGSEATLLRASDKWITYDQIEQENPQLAEQLSAANGF